MDDGELAAAVVAWLGNRSLACAESCTAGRVSQAFAAVGGATEWFRGGVVAYQLTVKRKLLALTQPTAFSERAVAEMAAGAAALLSADITVATSGVVGDEPQDGVPSGTVFVATSVDGTVTARTHHFEGDATEVMDAAVRQALHDVLVDVGATVDERSRG